MITKAMLAKCQNELGQAFGFLPNDVQQAIADNYRFVQLVDIRGKWINAEKSVNNTKDSYNCGLVYRLSPDTPTEPEVNWVEVPVTQNQSGVYEFYFAGYGLKCHLGYSISLVKCIGIVYEKDGVETLRTSVDAAFGTPKRVRMRK